VSVKTVAEGREVSHSKMRKKTLECNSVNSVKSQEKMYTTIPRRPKKDKMYERDRE